MLKLSCTNYYGIKAQYTWMYMYVYIHIHSQVYCAIEFKFIAWSSVAQSVCPGAFNLLEIQFKRPWVHILHSAAEDNFSPFYPTSLSYCQCIKINTNKYIYIYVCVCGVCVYLHTYAFTCVLVRQAEGYTAYCYAEVLIALGAFQVMLHN